MRPSSHRKAGLLLFPASVHLRSLNRARYNHAVTSYDRRAITLAIGLASLAGYVDACGYLATGGLFVSFMSGNSTRLSVTTARTEWIYAGLLFGVILLFVFGVILGSSIARMSGLKRKSHVLILVGILLAGGATFHFLGMTFPSMGLVVMAMGAENAVFQKDGEVTIGLTYMTGTLVRLGQQLTGILFGGPRDTWWPYALHWLGLVGGAILGAVAHSMLRSLSLWPAVFAAFFLSASAARLKPSEPL